MAGSRASWQDQTVAPLTSHEVKANKKDNKEQGKERMIDHIPGDKGSTVDQLRSRKQKLDEAIEGY